jgi:hypothetical protein
MPITTTAVFKCDRCGNESSAIEGKLNMLSVDTATGWARLMIDVPAASEGEPMSSIKGYLCPRCAGEFAVWVGMEGAGETFNRMKASPPTSSA